MQYETTINTMKIVIILLVGIIIILLYQQQNRGNDVLEHLTTTSVTTNEGLQNISAVYNTGNATLTNLNITGGLKIGGLTIDSAGNITTPGNITSAGKNSTLGKWTIIDNSIGIPGIADINMGTDAWLRLVNYGTGMGGAYAGTAGSAGGFAGQNLWCGGGTAFTNNINASGSATVNGTVTIGAPGGGDYTLWGGGDGFRICTGGANDTQRFFFVRSPAKQPNFYKGT
jgi:hypothetical protein